MIDFESGGQQFRASWVKASDTENIFLYPNFKEKLSAQKLFQEKDCQSLISAGFYTKENEPVGLFVSEGEIIKERIASRLFDGVFSIDKNGRAAIMLFSPPNVRLALQSGPILKSDREEQKLQIIADEAARRIVVAIDDKNEAYFVVFYNRDSLFEGPFLAKLPGVLTDFEKNIGVEFTEAQNLDGGSASAFYSPFLTLAELSGIGSYFCLRS